MPRTHYEILGVEVAATAAEIKAAYRRLIKLLHPDRAGDSPEAAERARLVIAAYEILSDPVKRREYDNLLELQQGSREQPAYSQRGHSREAPPEPLKCDCCGRVDSSLRVSVYVWVASVIIFTYKNGSCKIHCSRCRLWHTLLFNLEVLLLGWWGFPWGPIYSIGALLDNAKGGIQPAENNAALLAMLAYQLYQNGQIDESIKALESSETLQPRTEKREFLAHLRSLSHTRPTVGSSLIAALLQPAWANLVLAVCFVAAFMWLFTQFETSNPGGYASRFQKPVTVSTPKEVNQGARPSATSTSSTLDQQVTTKKKVAWEASNGAISSMASYIARKVPFVGTTQSTSGPIRNYELDRSALSVDSLRVYSNLTSMAYANAKSAHVDSETLRFAAACFYNAHLMEISVRTMNQLSETGNLERENVKRLRGLKQDTIVSAWLARSGIKNEFDALEAKVLRLNLLLDSLSRLEALSSGFEKKFASELDELELMEERLEVLRAAGQYEEHDRVIDLYNSRVEAYNRWLEQVDSLPAAADRLLGQIDELIPALDVAFNAALDKEILASEFDRVSIADSTSELNGRRGNAPSPIQRKSK